MQLNLFGVPEHQETTCQVPCGPYSIIDALENKEVTQAECFALLVFNKDSNWDTGQSRGLSYTNLQKQTGMARPSVIAIVKSLIEKGWLEKNARNTTEKHGQNTPNTYRVIHHQCEPHKAPRDSDGRPKKCAVPCGQGSPFQMVADGMITWKAALYWIRSKIESDWQTGVIEMTIEQARKFTGMTTQTICNIRKKLEQVGLVEKISAPFRAFACILFPKPYEKRRKRRRLPNPKGMRFDGEFSYSFNELWRVSHKDGHIETKMEGTSKWRHANEFECESANSKIFADFKLIIELITSPAYHRLVESSA